ncbi:MAG: HD domain-containing protein [Clostridiales bacterium]|nr:HD domain-containing protein [Clostridiales bacterium]
MNKQTYILIENYMLSCMRDAAHDKEHIYRVLYNALQIAQAESDVDYDVLITACLLHDIGRDEQFKNPKFDHAEVGGDKAYKFLTDNGFSSEFAEHVKSCIVTHRFRKIRPPESVEAKILFDADKLDVTGAMGVARTLMYKSGVGEPLYSIGEDGMPSNGEGDTSPSFFQEYNFKLKNLYDKFYTERGWLLAAERKSAAKEFYGSLYAEVESAYKNGKRLLSKFMD